LKADVDHRQQDSARKAAKRHAAARRQRTWRARDLAGVAVCPVPVVVSVPNMLIDLGHVGEKEYADGERVGRASLHFWKKPRKNVSVRDIQ
jgi:hypothetical protein